MGPKGKLWFDSDPGRSLEDKVKDACRTYRRAFGEEPNTVHISVHEAFEYEPEPEPDEHLPPEERESAGTILKGSVTVVFSKTCLPNHYFVFREEDERGTEQETGGNCEEMG